jgi:hypothetical protein
MIEQSTARPKEQQEQRSDLETYQGSYVSGQQPSAFTERQKQGTLCLNNVEQGILSEVTPR